MATSGKAPDVVKNPRDPAADRSLRPQVFSPNAGVELTLEMTPMARCVATAVDEEGTPVAGVKVESGPNVGWWNSGSEIYGRTLLRGEKVLLARGWNDAADTTTRAEPFPGQTDDKGMVTLLIQAGEERLVVRSEAHALPGHPPQDHSKRDVVVAGLRIVFVDVDGVIRALAGPPAPRHLLERQPLGTQEKLDLAAGVALPTAAAQAVGDLDFLSLSQIVHRVAAILHELDRDEVRERALRLLEDHETLAEALLAEGLGLLDEVNDAADGGVFHGMLAVGGLGRFEPRWGARFRGKRIPHAAAPMTAGKAGPKPRPTPLRPA